MKNQTIDMDIVQYSDKIAELLKGKNISTVVELHPQYTLVLAKMRLLGVNNYYGIEPEYPERTQQAIKYYHSMGINGMRAEVINHSPEEFLDKQKEITPRIAFISYQIDKKNPDMEKLAKKLYDKTPVGGLNIHLGIKDSKVFIDAGFREENRIYVKKQP